MTNDTFTVIQNSIDCARRDSEETKGLLEQVTGALGEFYMVSLKDCNNGGCLRKRKPSETSPSDK